MTDAWHSCYDLSWKDVIVPAAFSHPAKMSRGLLRKILDHAFEQGWISKGSIVCDPFGGIGSTAIEGAYRGLQIVTCELEPKFVTLAKENMALHARHWTTLGCPQPVILQGDSRKLCELVREAGIVVGSPPFQECLNDAKMKVPHDSTGNFTKDYGTTPGQLGAMKAGSIQAVVGSPPFLECLQSGKANSGVLAKGSESKYGSVGLSRDKHKNEDYGSTPGQLGAMKAGSVQAVVGSPPYAESPVQQTHMTSNQRGDPTNPNYRPSWKKKLAEGYDKTTRPYGETAGQLGQLPSGSVEAILSSSPYEGSEGTPSIGRAAAVGGWMTGGGIAARAGMNAKYGDSAGQVGHTQGDTFWSAARLIVDQCHALLSPGGHAIWVVKDFVRNKQRVDFTGDWRRLCEAIGFTLVCEHQAMLVKTWEEPTLFEGTVQKERSRKSFFRRLCEAKGSPRIDWETVLCLTRD